MNKIEQFQQAQRKNKLVEALANRPGWKAKFNDDADLEVEYDHYNDDYMTLRMVTDTIEAHGFNIVQGELDIDSNWGYTLYLFTLADKS